MKNQSAVMWFTGTLLWILPFGLWGNPICDLLADDLGYGDVEYQGGNVPTPSIDSTRAG